MRPGLHLHAASAPCAEHATLFNSGGPRSRTRIERLRSTVLGNGDGCIRSPRVRRLGLEFGDADPVETAWGLLEAAGFTDPEALRHVYALPDQALICRANALHPPRPVTSRPARKVLEEALWLGLCTAWMLDPSRPVVWTRASLTRRIEVFTAEGFYA